MFTRKFERLAASYSDTVFCEILGDENNDTRVRLPPACTQASGNPGRMLAATLAAYMRKRCKLGALGAFGATRRSHQPTCFWL